MNRRAFLIGFSVFAATTIVGCKTDSGEDYVGNWRAVNSNVEITIARNGDAFTMTVDPKMSIARKGDSVRRLPAVLTQEGLLEFNEGVGSRLISIDKTTGNLLAFGMEFSKFDK